MAHTRSRRRQRHRALRGEAPSTVAVLTTEDDFAAMRAYRTFTFVDFADYLRHVRRLVRALDAEGVHTRLAPFLPAVFAAYCTQGALEPDTAASRTRYTAEVAAAGLTIPYRGQRWEQLLPLLRAQRRRETARHASSRSPGDSVHRTGLPSGGATALRRAADALDALLAALGPGAHHLVCSVDGPRSPLLAVLQAVTESDGACRVDAAEVRTLCSVLAAGFANGSSGGLVARTTSASADGRTTEWVRGWSLHRGWLAPLSEGEVFSAYCTHAETGEPLPPEPGVDYRAGLPLPRPAPEED